jgi:hypothetical protein
MYGLALIWRPEMAPAARGRRQVHPR